MPNITALMMVLFIKFGVIISKDNSQTVFHLSKMMSAVLTTMFNTESLLESITISILITNTNILDKLLKLQLKMLRNQSLLLLLQPMNHQLQERNQRLEVMSQLAQKLQQRMLNLSQHQDLKLLRLKLESQLPLKTQYLRLIHRRESLTSPSCEMIPIENHQSHGYTRIVKLIFLMGHTPEKLRPKSTFINLIKHILPKAESIDHIMKTELLEEGRIFHMYQTIELANTITGGDKYTKSKISNKSKMSHRLILEFIIHSKNNI